DLGVVVQEFDDLASRRGDPAIGRGGETMRTGGSKHLHTVKNPGNLADGAPRRSVIDDDDLDSGRPEFTYAHQAKAQEIGPGPGRDDDRNTWRGQNASRDIRFTDSLHFRCRFIAR